MQNFIWNVRANANSGPQLKRRAFALLFRLIELLFGAGLALGAKFKGQPCFPHGIHGVFVSGGAHIGQNCVIFQGVTIGSNTLIGSKSFGAPTIGDNCYIGAGAKLVGNIRVGNNVRVGANAVVFKDVPDNATVVAGSTQPLLSTTPQDNRYFCWLKGRWQYFDNGRWLQPTPEEEAILRGDGALRAAE